MASLTEDFSPRLLIVGNRMMRFLATFGPKDSGEKSSDAMWDYRRKMRAFGHSKR